MIRRETENGWILITQRDHSLLSGKIMKGWGNSKFATPEPYDEVMFAVAEHDCGWELWEENPRINPVNKYPKNFLEMNYSDQVSIWKRSFLKHSKKHPYASSLIALHFDKFNSSILRKNKNALLLKSQIKEFVLENLGLKHTGQQSLSEQIINNLKFVQIGDIISLALCHGWRSTQIDDIPYRLNGKNISILLSSDDGLNYKINPFPFSKFPITLNIEGKIIDRKTFTNNYEFLKAYKTSQKTNLKFTINN
ncbi:MAG: DUF3891 family protein [Candidatus Dadabacteria bacterium]|nr:DUF3891 family protein [Candidatus Dadabacteria bacterium]NIS08538.1 DUF3891 family protein [Candidatus Dadabacteria bacterium]NIV41366.1 DUF3891 family protein [Candidatus Dadabacteria bacterium]NIX14573.1 DUF3891 family protein [Candidatus Dadabacteria bacterium]NIY21028.1 DUF3891 family protein [Candidatus Dadabacteria bacterium]